MEFLIVYDPSRLKQAIYEPKLGENRKNPEATLIYDCGITIDVEVKTPGFKKSNKEQEPSEDIRKKGEKETIYTYYRNQVGYTSENSNSLKIQKRN